MRILVTGGCGYIGSHLTTALLRAGHEVAIVDNLSNSLPASLDAIARLADAEPVFRELDINNTDRLMKFFKFFEPEAVMHLAGLKQVRHSVLNPSEYYRTNLGGTISLLKVMGAVGVRLLIFSSSGSVYGETCQTPIKESHPHVPSNPYSATKSMSERILSDLCSADPKWRVVALRYFNPAGAHPDGLLGESPVGPPTNLLPILMMAASGKPQGAVSVYGVDFPTRDGSAIRDYVHVSDVAAAHIQALELARNREGFTALNIGRGIGVSVLELIATVKRVTGRDFGVNICPRRPGDVSALVGDTSVARSLGFVTCRPLDQICYDAWQWELCRHQSHSV